jgi:Fic family protein
MKKQNIFRHSFLRGFSVETDNIRLDDAVLKSMDDEVSAYELASPSDVRQALINRNEIMSSYAISQAEDSSTITPKQASGIRNSYDADPGLKFTVDMSRGVQGIEKAFDSQEYLNILRTFRWVSNRGVAKEELSVETLRRIHGMLTESMDAFVEAFHDVAPEVVAVAKKTEGKFHPYRSGRLRETNTVVVGNYHPADFRQISSAVRDAIDFYKSSPSLRNLNIFTTALYAIHPFSNGNKRVCRILEHALIRDLGFNRSNIYGHSYYYYRELKRFYEHLTRSLETRNLVPTVNFAREGIFYSMLYVYQLGIINKRREFITNLQRRFGDKTDVLALMVKKKEVGFSELRDSNFGKMTERTLVNYLNGFTKGGHILKRRSGREMLYRLFDIAISEEKRVKKFISECGGDLFHIPEELEKTVYSMHEVPPISSGSGLGLVFKAPGE